MNTQRRTRYSRMLAALLLVSSVAWAQQGAATLSGKVAAASGAAVAGASVSVKNAATGQSTTTQTDGSGLYTVPNLTPGIYEVSVAAPGFATQSEKVTLAAGARQNLDIPMTAAAGNAGAPSLGDLGFSPEQTKGNPQEQARLDRRSHMLKIHQRLGLITIAPLVATLISSNGAAEHENTSGNSGRKLHAALGGITAGMYLTTASFAIFAPKAPPGTTVRGPIRLHKALAWVHGSGMILTPILGALAYQQRSRGERVHGIAQAHAPMAVITGIAYGLAIVSVSIKF